MYVHVVTIAILPLLASCAALPIKYLVHNFKCLFFLKCRQIKSSWRRLLAVEVFFE